MSFIVYLLIFESFRTTQSRIARIDLYKDQLHVQATCGLHFVVLRNIHSLLGGHFCFRQPPPSPPRSPPSRIPVTFQHGWFPPVGNIFPSKNAVALYYYAKEFAPSGPRPPPSEFPLPSFRGKIWIFLELGIHHFHRDHKAPYLPPKFCITIVFDSFREDRNTQEN